MFAEIVIRRPKFALVISIVTALVGAICLTRLPIAEYPEIAPPTIRVTAMYPGATSQVIAETVATVIEEQVNGIEDLLYFQSASDNTGNYTLTLTFKPGIDSDIARVYTFYPDGSELSLLELANFVRMNVKDAFARLPGLGSVEILGERNY